MGEGRKVDGEGRREKGGKERGGEGGEERGGRGKVGLYCTQDTTHLCFPWERQSSLALRGCCT